jgi:tRNA-specific 2-thiouridylase
MNLPGDPARTRVVAAMSGGVDSAVAAALAKRAGYDVVGVTLQLSATEDQPKRKGSCCAGQDIYDAKLAAERIGIAHYTLDYEAKFRASVMDEFAAAYARGETPIPCVRCNETVKFRDLLNAAKDMGAAALITGHYIRRVDGANGPELHRARCDARPKLFRPRRRGAARLHSFSAGRILPRAKRGRSRRNWDSISRQSLTVRISVSCRTASTATSWKN